MRRLVQTTLNSTLAVKRWEPQHLKARAVSSSYMMFAGICLLIILSNSVGDPPSACLSKRGCQYLDAVAKILMIALHSTHQQELMTLGRTAEQLRPFALPPLHLPLP